MESKQLKRERIPIESLWAAETLMNLAQSRVQETASQSKLLRKKMKAAKKEFKLAKKTARQAKKKLALARQSFAKAKAKIEQTEKKGLSVVPSSEARTGIMPKGAMDQKKVQRPVVRKPKVKKATSTPRTLPRKAIAKAPPKQAALYPAPVPAAPLAIHSSSVQL